ncbi:type II secretion system F family protein [Nesterenkonia marinintestina]|uniref:type II secretion system F family protein n=1 Tax=Nesterenkonia marinintestina TaxID=2979865 RepID=UPI0021C09F9D|nr:type II secretion system F family protein [Nesterenkonia sp. GX14115]
MSEPRANGFRRRREDGARTEDCDVDAAMLLDLTGALLSAGVGVEAALERLAATVPGAEPLAGVHRSLAAGADWATAWSGLDVEGRSAQQLGAFADQLAFAHSTGAPTAELLEVGARQLRTERRHGAERAAAQLGVKMVLPLGACYLPAFVLIGVVPVALGLLPGALDM